ncbi:MAG: SDR family NAD(P)-dependent oxidoreductase [Tissierellia bacterium]|nr:SDR family NAD(P)-dependent oxidoreductase [Tissierellia bacterium]
MKKNIALVTGASSGLGKEFVRLLLDDSCIDEIWTIARDIEKLNALRKEFGEKLVIFSVDLSEYEQIRNFEKIIVDSNINIKFLINNAGFGKFGAFDVISIEESINMINLNICAVVTMCLICIPFMDMGSHIINVSSQSSFQPLPYFNIYASTKVFIRHYSRALNIELKDKCIYVTTVCPSWLDTNFFARSKTNAKKSPNNFVGMETPFLIAKKALKDSKLNKALSIYGPHSMLSHLAGKLLPQSLLMSIWLRQQNL